MNRRNFIGAILAAASAPAVVRSGSIMRIAAPAGMIGGPVGILTMLDVAREQALLNAEMRRLTEWLPAGSIWVDPQHGKMWIQESTIRGEELWSQVS